MATKSVDKILAHEKAASDALKNAEAKAGEIIESAKAEAEKYSGEILENALAECKKIRDAAKQNADLMLDEAYRQAQINGNKIRNESSAFEKEAKDTVTDILFG